MGSSPPEVVRGNYVPTLNQTWQTAADVTGDNFIGDAPKDGGTQTDPPAPTHLFFKVSPGSIRDAENTILNATKGQIADFESFKKEVEDESTWIFVAEGPNELGTHQTWHGGYYTGAVSEWDTTSDPDPEDTAKVVFAQDQLLAATGGAIELVATYIAALNNTAQMYARADKKSFPPTYAPLT